MFLILLFAVLAGFVAWGQTNKRLYNDGFSPLNLLFYFWVLPLSLRLFGLSSYESEWDLKTVFVFSWVTFYLAFTCIVPALLMRHYSFSARRPIFERTMTLFRSKPLINWLLFFFILSFAAYVYSEFVTNPIGIAAFTLVNVPSTVLGDLHRWGKDTRWAIITPLLFVLTPMLYFGFRVSRKKRQKLLLLLLAMLFPLMGLLKFSKSDVYIATLNIAFVEYYYRKYNSRRSSISKVTQIKMVMALLVAIALMYVSVVLRIGADAPNVYASLGFNLNVPSPLYEILALVYAYFALPFENFHRFLMSYPGDLHLGISFFRPLLSLFAQGNVADAMIATINFNVISGAANTGTFLTPIYAELGMVGLVIVPPIYGALVNILYGRFRIKPNFMNFLLYMNFVYPWTWLFFTNAFSVLTFYINSAFVIFLTLLVARRRIGRRTLLND